MATGIRLRLVIAAAVSAATALLGACTPIPAPPRPSPVRGPNLPVDVADLKGAPPVRDLTGRFAYGAADGHIWTIDAATGHRTQITRGRDGPDFDPHWSPDGSRLVFRTERFRPPDPTSTGYNGIFVIDDDGTGERAVNPPGGGLFPEWSPANQIVFSSPGRDGSEGLYTVRPDGTGLQDLRTYAEHVAWSPSGTRTLLDRNDGIGSRQDWNIWRATATFGDLRQLTTAAGDDHFGGWSPDGAAIVFSTTRTDD